MRSLSYWGWGRRENMESMDCCWLSCWDWVLAYEITVRDDWEYAAADWAVAAEIKVEVEIEEGEGEGDCVVMEAGEEIVERLEEEDEAEVDDVEDAVEYDGEELLMIDKSNDEPDCD